MKKVTKKVYICLSICSFCCASCSLQNKFEDGVYDTNPAFLSEVIYWKPTSTIDFACLYKVNFKSIDKSIYSFKPTTVELNKNPGQVTDIPFGILDYLDEMAYCNSENNMVLCSRDDIGDSIEYASSNGQKINRSLTNIDLYITLDDTCYGNMFGLLSKKYIRVNRLNNFLTSYDYFYVNVSEVNSFYNTNRDIYYKNKKTNINEGILINPKGFRMFPVKEGKIKLDELVKFHKNNYEIGYDYKNIEDYVSDGEAKRYFVDYFHNDMDEEELLSSFSALFDNPPNKYYIP